MKDIRIGCSREDRARGFGALDVEDAGDGINLSLDAPAFRALPRTTCSAMLTEKQADRLLKWLLARKHTYK